MAEFRFFTRGDSSVRGKARIYFTAHPDDYEKYFGEICKDILERQNCAIFCLDRDTMPEEVEDFELRMGEMQLLVVLLELFLKIMMRKTNKNIFN